MLVLRRLDYCNALLAGLFGSTITLLQWVQNVATSLILGLPPRKSVSSALTELHQLPTVYCIKFKILLSMFKVQNGCSPAYISAAVMCICDNPSHQLLCSSYSTGYIIPWTEMKSDISSIFYLECSLIVYHLLTLVDNNSGLTILTCLL